jgi:hypothetical protein
MLRKLQTHRRICGCVAVLAIGWWYPAIVLGQGATEPAISSQPPPSGSEQDRLLDRMHQYAEQYVSKLPNFLCEQVTRQFQAGKKSKRWSEGDTLTSKLSFNQGHELRSLELVNGRQVESGRRKPHMPLVTEGEFGILLAQVLGADSGAAFSWNRWDRLGDKRVAVFDYVVDREHSTLSLSLSDLARAVIPYSGSVYADPDSGTVWRITDTATEIPPALETQQISTTVDYRETKIGEIGYILPTEATVTLLLKKKKVRNEMEFNGYRKFEANSAITFGSSTDSPNQTTAPERK